MAELDFELARQKHLAWRSRVRDFLDGVIDLTGRDAGTHRDCDLGRWLYSEAVAPRLRNYPESQALLSDHKDLHEIVHQLIELAHAGDRSGAETRYNRINQLSMSIVAHLYQLEFQVLRHGGHWWQRIANLSITGKLITNNAIAIMLFIGVGLLGFIGLRNMGLSVERVNSSALEVDASMEMKLAVATDLQMVMEILASDNQASLDGAWDTHQTAVKTFDLFVKAILHGAVTDEGIYQPSVNSQLRQKVSEADQLHNDEFQPIMAQLRGLVMEDLRIEAQQKLMMGEFEQTFNQMMEQTEQFEGAVKQRIAQRIEAGDAAADILNKENGWADLSMELKTLLAQSRISVEEYAQSLDPQEHQRILSDYRQHIAAYDGFVEALLDGGDTGEGTIQAIDHAGLRKQLKQIDSFHNDRFQGVVRQYIELSDQRVVNQLKLKEMDRLVDSVGEKTAALLDEVEEVAKVAIQTASASADATQQQMSWLMLMGIVVSSVVGVSMAWVIIRAIDRPLQSVLEFVRKFADGNMSQQLEISSRDEMGELLTMMRSMNQRMHAVVSEVRNGANAINLSSQEVSAGNTDLSQRTEEQAASLEETASSLEQITSTVRQNADNSRIASQLVADTRDKAVAGGAVVQESIEAMGKIKSSAKEIANIISVIDEIAFQTNLLALNAAVEAARAGEQGRGFAVVAGEVRMLAQRSANAAKEIKLLITDSVQRIDEGARLTDASGETLSGIINAVKKVNDLIIEISAASEQQSAGIEQINQAVAQLDTTTQQNAAMVEELAATSKSQSDQAAGLIETTNYFKL